jgi:hypothetical protein
LEHGKELVNKKKPEEAILFLLAALKDPEILDECNDASKRLCRPR